MENIDKDLLSQTRFLEFYKRAILISKDSIINYHKFKKQRTEKGFINAINKFLEANNYPLKIAKSKILLGQQYLGNKDNFIHERAYTFKDEYIDSELTKARTNTISEFVYTQTYEILTKDDAINGLKQLIELYMIHYRNITQIKKESKEEHKLPKNTNHIIQLTNDPKINIKNAILYMEYRLKKGNYTRLTEQEIIDYKEAFNDISTLSSKYYSINTINQVLDINYNHKVIKNYNKRNSFIESKLLQNIIDMSLNIYDTLTLHLLSDTENKEYDLLLNTIGLTNAINKYERSYDLFIKYYNELPSKEKEDIIVRFNEKYYKRYKETFDINEFHILTPLELKDHINYCITSKMINKHDKCTSIYYDEKTLNTLIKRTSMMEVNQIVELYKSLCEKERQTYLFNKSTNNNEKTDNEYTSRITNLQNYFATLIALKISSYNLDDYTSKMSKDLKAKEELLTMIIRDYFKESVLFSTLYKQEEETPSIKEIYDAKVEAHKRFYSLNKIEQTTAKIKGTWNTYNQLISKNILTKEELNTLNGMFR